MSILYEAVTAVCADSRWVWSQKSVNLGVAKAVDTESSWRVRPKTCLHVDLVCTSSQGGTRGVLGGVWRGMAPLWSI